jgi:hypothetical protein
VTDVLCHMRAKTHLQLHNVFVVVVHRLLIKFILQRRLENGIGDAGAVQSREQVLNETFEERHVLVHELREVRVAQRPHKHQVLRHVCELTLQRPRLSPIGATIHVRTKNNINTLAAAFTTTAENKHYMRAS